MYEGITVTIERSCKHLVAINRIENGSSEEVFTDFHSTHLDSRSYDKSSLQWYIVNTITKIGIKSMMLFVFRSG